MISSENKKNYKTVLESPIGWISIEGDSLFIHGILFNDKKPKAELSENPPSIILQCVNELDLYFKGRLRLFTVPMKQDGTVFQQSIWNHLSNIPYGKTCSYLDIAKKSGDSKNTRAIGTANGKNNLAIAVPCHRVIGNDGSMTGYGGGLWRKGWLLNHEAKVANGVIELF